MRNPALLSVFLWIFPSVTAVHSVISEECSIYDKSANFSRTKSVADRTVKLKVVLEPKDVLFAANSLQSVGIGLSESEHCGSIVVVIAGKCQFIRTDGKARVGPIVPAVFAKDVEKDLEENKVKGHQQFLSSSKLQCVIEFEEKQLVNSHWICLQSSGVKWESLDLKTEQLREICKVISSNEHEGIHIPENSIGDSQHVKEKRQQALDENRQSREVTLRSPFHSSDIEADLEFIPRPVAAVPLPDVRPAVIHGIRIDEPDSTVERIKPRGTVQRVFIQEVRVVLIGRKRFKRNVVYCGFLWLLFSKSDKEVEYENGAAVILAGSESVVRLFGSGLTTETQIRFVVGSKNRSEHCRGDLLFPVPPVQVSEKDLRDYSATVKVKLPLISSDVVLPPGDPVAFSICTLSRTGNIESWIHQGRDPWLYIKTYAKPLPLWVQIVLIIILLTLSGLFSGLNLGLMSLDQTELKILINTGTDKEKSYAKAIIPVRNHGNYLLCTLLLGNVLVNSTLTIFLDDLTSGLVAVIGSTMGIVIFGEIVPQAICSRYGLAVGAHTIWITKFFMLMTFPLSYPISKLLDWILGEEIGAYYNRERLKELIRVTQNYHGLERDEVNIIAGALEMKKKTVADVMTKIENVYMLSEDAILDYETVTEIVHQGYSRIPVYTDGDRRKICGIIFAKDLALLDPDDLVPVKRFCQFYHRDLNFVFDDVTLDVMFRDFKEGSKGHMAFVYRVNSEGECDPFYETIGLVTLEDVIEELIQSEIIDETDVWEDNRHRRKRLGVKKVEDFPFCAPKRDQSFVVSPQLQLAAFQFLSTSVEPFTKDHISESVLRRMMLQPIIRHIKVKDREKGKSDLYTVLYTRGKLADYFILILEGHVEVTAGKENMVFESGPFSYYGVGALTWTPSDSRMIDSPSGGQISNRGSVTGSIISQGESTIRGYIPDYTVRAITDVTFVRVKRSLYKAARSATEMERNKTSVGASSMDLESELDKVLNAGNEEVEMLTTPDDGAGRGSRPNSKRNSAVFPDRMLNHSDSMSRLVKLGIPNGIPKRGKSVSTSTSPRNSTDSLVTEPRDRSSSLKGRPQNDIKESFTVSLPLSHLSGSRIGSRPSAPILTGGHDEAQHNYGSFDSVPSVRVGHDTNAIDSQFEPVDDKTNLLKTSPV